MTKQELASKIWAMADKMRSKIKANEYKDYILGFMFYKFLSDKELDFLLSSGFTLDEIKEMCDRRDELKAKKVSNKKIEESYNEYLESMEYLKDNIGYAIDYNDLFSTWKSLGIKLDVARVSKGLSNFNKNINEAQKSVFYNIFNTLQNGIDKLGDTSGLKSKAVRDIVDMIDSIPTRNTQGYDVLGYIYEFLIYKFATAAKDDGAFYTPHEVSSLIAKIIANSCKDLKELKVYDPTSGSGSLLLNIGEEASKYIDGTKIKYYGQEKITETYHLTRMNLIMKGVPSQNVIVRNGDTLEEDWPYFDDNVAYSPLRVNAVVSNPPYSLHWDPESRTKDDRFKKYGLAPAGKADYAFLLHCLYHMENDGVMAIVLPHGVLFRGDSEYQIRQNLCKEHNIETIIGLPANLFYATSIPTIIMILRKNRSSDDILFIDASQNYEKGKNQNVLRACDIKRIFDAVTERKSIDNFARLVSYEEIKNNDFNLNIPRYVSASKESDTYDFAALMNGTVSNKELDKWDRIWNEFTSLRSELYTDLGNGYSSFNDVNIKTVVDNNDDVKRFRLDFKNRLSRFKIYLTELLIKKYTGDIKDFEEKVVNKLFDMVSDIAIIDKYDVYQLLMNNWSMLEADFNIMQKNKIVCRNTEPRMVLKKVNKVDTEVQDGWKGTIIPFDLVGDVYFSDKYSELKNIKNKIAECDAEIESICDSLSDLFSEDKKVSEANVKAIIKAGVDDDVLEDFKKVLDIYKTKKALNKKIKDSEVEILTEIKTKIETLTNNEIDDMLVHKWIDPLCKELENVTTQVIDAFIKELECMREKYVKPLSEIEKDIHSKDEELLALLTMLTGSEVDMQAIEGLKAVLF